MALADELAKLMGMGPPTKPGQLNLAPGPMQLATPPGFDLSAMQQAAPPQNFLQRLGRDPSLSLALMNAGISMMQPTPAGQTHLGHAAKGLGIGAQTYIADTERLRQNSREDKRMQLLENADTRAAAQDAREGERWGLEKELAPLKKKAAKLGLDEATIRTGLLRQFGAKEAQAKLDAAEAQIRALDAKAQAYENGTVGGAGGTAAQVQVIDRVSQVYQGLGVAKTEADRLATERVFGGRSTPVKDVLGLHKAIQEIQNNLFLDEAQRAAAIEQLRMEFKTAQGRTAEGQVGAALDSVGGGTDSGTLGPDRTTMPPPGKMSLQELTDLYTKQAPSLGYDLTNPEHKARLDAFILQAFQAQQMAP